MNEKGAIIPGGAILISRQIIDSEIFYDKPDKWLKLWLYILCRVSFKTDKKYQRGELFLKYEWISDATGASKGQIDKFIRFAKSVDMISTRQSTRGFIIKVNKYGHYQELDNYYYDVPVDTENASRSKQSRSKVDTILKNEKNDKNVYIPIKSKSKISPSLVGKEITPEQNIKQFEKYKSDEKRYVHLIGRYYLQKVNLKQLKPFPTLEALKRDFKRQLKPAQELSEYSDERIYDAIKRANKRTKEWTLLTVCKYINK